MENIGRKVEVGAASERTLACEQCGADLPVKRRSRPDQPTRFCSGRCRAAWHHAEFERNLEKIRELLAKL